MDKKQIILKLTENRELLDRFGVKEVRLFGSVARDQANTDSDIDLLVEFEPTAQIGLFEFSKLKYELSQLLGCDVDLATQNALHRHLKERILKEAIRAA
jgi:predicted nucleotidyltransferase